MKRLLLFVLALVFGFQLYGQDQDFSQYYALPTFLNPALTGSFNGTYRFGIIYRDQWRQVSPVPLSTYAFNGEYKFRASSRSKRPDYGGIGMTFFTDRTGLIEQNTNSIALSGAFHKSLNQRKLQYISMGFHIGIVQKNLNYTKLFFEDQFDKINTFNKPTSETLENNNFAYGDYNLGVAYAHELNKKNAIYLGATLKHLTQPNVSFWRNSGSQNPDLITKNKLPLLVGFQYNSDHQVSYRIGILPRLIVQWQGPHYQIMTGGNLRFGLGTFNNSFLHIGTYTRMTNDAKTPFYVATITPLIGFEINDLLIGLSYDVAISDVARNYKNIGIFEFSLRYTGETLEDTAICPQF